jgi:hypothetical protein
MQLIQKKGVFYDMVQHAGEKDTEIIMHSVRESERRKEK